MDFTLEQVANLLHSSNDIVITAHVQPDGDCLGSMLALKHCLAASGKTVSMVLDDDIPPLYQFLPGCEEIIQPDSTVIRADLLIVLDASDIERIGRVREHITAPILNIDHHVSNTKFADFWYIDNRAAATGEIIFSLLKLLQADITKDMATCLYTAIATDCGFFRYANTSAQTMRFAADLLELGASPHIISEYMEAKSFDSIQTLGKVLETLTLHHNGKIASIVISDTLSPFVNTEGFINFPRIVEGVEIAIMFKMMLDGTIRISFRSKGVNVSKLALSFGGGGHARAAGCALKGRLDDVMNKVLQSASRQLTELGK